MSGDYAWSERPYKQLGNRLKSAREEIRETLAEVSGAVEIDIDTLQSIEIGEKLPGEETLLLLINHFDLNDDEAGTLLEMAGYLNKDGSSPEDIADNIRQLIAIVAPDNKIAYTDSVNILANSQGVVINFMQSSGMGSQQSFAARVGMSKEQAKELLGSLQKALDQRALPDRPKALPAPKANKTIKEAN